MFFVHVTPMFSLLVITCYLLPQIFTLGFSIARNDNLAVFVYKQELPKILINLHLNVFFSYWGQDGAGNQQRLSFYCNDDTIDTIPMAFLYVFFGEGGQPVIDFANICSESSGTFPGTQLANCSFLAADIKECQTKGKIVTLSLGGGVAQVGFNNESQASGFATTIWNMFLGGNGDIRPLGDAVLDGVDLDIESGPSEYYDTFVNTLRSLATNAPKQYFVTAAPQCPFPDQEIGNALNSAFFDAIYVQFYNNYCETSKPSDFNMATWDQWAKNQSPNPNIKVYLGAPASPNAAGSGYVSNATLARVALEAQKNYSSFGGVMLWDASEAQANNLYHVAVKNAIRNKSGVSPSNNPALSSSLAPALDPSSPFTSLVHSPTSLVTSVPPPSSTAHSSTSAIASVLPLQDPSFGAQFRLQDGNNGPALDMFNDVICF